ncbi:MAG TPA: flavodoxin [Candidatus Faecimorpha stercoravium]|nr:flavodoxin [Candidatus Faecimorpha stercoravium]
MKKHIAWLLGMILVFCLAACTSSPAGNTSTAENVSANSSAGEESSIAEESSATEESSAATESSVEETSSETAAEDRVLVVFFSATGNTEAAAQYIAELTGGDLFELEPVEPYTDADLDWTDSGSRVVYEHENPEEQAVELEATTVDDWDSYSTVYIGYPIWWGQAAWPVNAFIEVNDFTGKTVIPFCTSSSSGLGQSGELLAEMAGTGDWQEGVRFSSNVSEEDVQSWLESLGE